MKTIRFEKDFEEEGLRVIVLNGLVEYTDREGVYRVPNYVLELLKENHIPFKIDEHNYARQ